MSEVNKDMKRQLSDPAVSDASDCEEMEDDDEYPNYYLDNTDDLDIDKPKKSDDPEYFEYTILKTEDAERLLNEEVEALCSALKVSPSLAKMLLHVCEWKGDMIIQRYQQDQQKFLTELNIQCAREKREDSLVGSHPTCPVCIENYPRDKFMGLSCSHYFCPACWEMHFRYQIEQGVTMGIECMGQKCRLLVPEDFLYGVLTDPKLRDRFSKLCFTDLIKDTNMRLSIEAGERLAVTLRFLASGDCYKSMSYLYRIGHSTLGKIIPETCRAIVAVLKERYLKVPSAEDSWKQIALEFEEKWQFPHCIGAIDGKHVAIKAPPNSGSVYFNYKEFHSIILLAVVDAQYRFIWYAVGHNGRQNDAGVFGESSIKKALDQNTLNFPPPSKIRENSQVAVPYVLVGDDAFPLKTSPMKPYPQRGLTDRERIFNYRLSRARRVSENAFGILVNRFRVLYHTMIVNPDSATDIIESCLALHNFLRTERDVRYNQIHTNTQQSTATERPVLFRGNNNAEQARAVRDELREYFWADGQVPFQWSMIK